MSDDLLAEIREISKEMRRAHEEHRELADEAGEAIGAFEEKYRTHRIRIRNEHPSLRKDDLDDEAMSAAMPEFKAKALLVERERAARKYTDSLGHILSALQSELKHERELTR